MRMRRTRILWCAVVTAALHGGMVRAEGDTEQIPQQVQSAVERGLQWLAGHQNATTGEWPTEAGRSSPVAAVTSLGAMAFMARGHVPGQGMYGDNINRAVDRVLSLQQPSGLIASEETNIHAMYDHGISTVMLCEAYGMLDEKRQDAAGKAIAKAVRVILAAQAMPKGTDSTGGWRYTPDATDSDISVTGWQLMALRGAANIGATVPKRAIDLGIAYVKRRAQEDGGFGYGDGGLSGGSTARTGTGILALELLGQHNARESLAGGSYLMRTPATYTDSEFYFYAQYYCAQAAWQLGGNYWNTIDKRIRDSLLGRQHMDGSWSTTTGNEAAAGEGYATSMSILALTVPYRYLPIYQR